MVFYFTSIPCEAAPEGYVLYMGKDKFENDDLIKHAWPEDVFALPAQHSLHAPPCIRFTTLPENDRFPRPSALRMRARDAEGPVLDLLPPNWEGRISRGR